MIPEIIKFKVSVINRDKGETDNTYRDRIISNITKTECNIPVLLCISFSLNSFEKQLFVAQKQRK